MYPRKEFVDRLLLSADLSLAEYLPGCVVAIISLVLGIINLCSWFLPICGIPTAIIGLTLGFIGLNSSQKTLAVVGMILSGIGLVLGIMNAVLGAYLSVNKTDFLYFKTGNKAGVSLMFRRASSFKLQPAIQKPS